MDSLDDIEAKNHRNLETAELVSAYMRANAQRAAQRAAQQQAAPETVPEEPPREPESDKLDFSSEFSTGDMGLSSQGSPAELLAWKRQIEEEEERHDSDSDDDEQAEEWKSGSWQDKDDEGSAEQEQPEESAEDTSQEPPDATPSPTLETSETSEAVASASASTSLEASGEQAPRAAAAEPATPQEVASAVESAQQFWGAPAETTASETAKAPFSAPTQQPIQAVAPTSLHPERLRPAVQAELAPRGQLAEIDSSLAQLARNLIASPSEQDGYEECVRLLARFGAGALRICAREKVRVEILDEHGFAAHPGLQALGLSAEELPRDGAYLIESRQVLVDRRSLLGRPRFFHPVLYYFAHAFDHAQGAETFASRKAAAVVACFEASTRAHNGLDFVDELAAADPVRYFARSVAVYLGDEDCSDPLWSHQDLYDFDRSMYDYLQYLFARLGR